MNLSLKEKKWFHKLKKNIIWISEKIKYNLLSSFDKILFKWMLELSFISQSNQLITEFYQIIIA